MVTKSKVGIGTPVLVPVDVRVNNYEQFAAGIVTRVIEVEDDDTRYNVTVFLDTGEQRRYGNILIVSKEPEIEDPKHPELVAFQA